MHNGYDIPVTDDRSEIWTWLSPLKPHLRHHAIRTSRVMGIGDWLLRTEEFRSWRNGDGQSESQKATIFCSGNLGVGKTYISSLVIDTLCGEAGGAGEDIAVACFYFDSVTQKEQSATSVMGALLKQVVGSFEQIPEEITDEFRRHKKLIGGRELQLPEIVKMLGSLSSTQPTFFCLDALDECAAPDRTKVLASLKDIIKMSPTARVFLTGRPYVGGEVGKNFPGGAALVSVTPRSGDIIGYIRAKLAEDTALGEMDERLEAEIVKKVPETVSEIFPLVSLNLDAIIRENTIHRRRERLRVMTTGLGLGNVYGATLDRIKAQDSYKSRLGMTALMWICYSGRQLGPEELCEALAVEIGSTDYNADDAPSMETVLSCCQGFFMVDKEGSTIRLIHHTLREYLISHRSFFQSPHSTIAESCLTYLNSEQVMALSYSGVQSTQPSRFLQYSSIYWGAHMRKEPTDYGRTLALKLFSRYKCHVSIRLLLEHTLGRHRLRSIVDFDKFTGLHYASIFGLVEVARALTMIDGVNINGTDEMGATPLIWAAMSGHEAAVKFLLELEGVDPDRPDNNGRTPISWAAENGRGAVVGLLLRREDVNPDRPDNGGYTPISWAAENGHEAVVKLLLGWGDVAPDRTDNGGRTPISWAAQNGHTAVVKLLLGQEDVNPDWPDHEERAPISWAAENGHEAVVKLLLERKDVNPDRPDHEEQTPMSWAAKNGHETVVKLLLVREDANLDRLNNHDETLWLAVRGGHEAAVGVLLWWEDVNPNRPDHKGQTPLGWAAQNGYEAMVKLLLGRGDVDPDRPDRWGQTPISWASENGYEAVVQLLLGCEGVNPDRLDEWNRTPILLAAQNGYEAVVKLLLAREDVNPDRPDRWGRAPISWASRNGHEAVVKLLLEREDVNPNRPDYNGQTPISSAVENKEEAVVKLLLGPEKSTLMIIFRGNK